MNQQRGFTLLEMMLVLALVAITASVVLFTYGREDVASTRARETAARFTAALELAIDRATLDFASRLRPSEAEAKLPLIIPQSFRTLAGRRGRASLPEAVLKMTNL